MSGMESRQNTGVLTAETHAALLLLQEKMDYVSVHKMCSLSGIVWFGEAFWGGRELASVHQQVTR